MIPFTVYEPLPLGDVRPTSITLHLADQDPADILGDIPAIVGNFAFPVDFVCGFTLKVLRHKAKYGGVRSKASHAMINTDIRRIESGARS